MKNFIKTIKKRYYSKLAEKNYIKAAKLAKERYEKNDHTPQYVISSPDNENCLMVCNSKEFIEMRKKQGMVSKELPLSQLKRYAWYRTPQKNGLDALTPKDVIRRKMTYVHMILESHGLLG